jgi:hypothetical protein
MILRIARRRSQSGGRLLAPVVPVGLAPPYIAIHRLLSKLLLFLAAFLLIVGPTSDTRGQPIEVTVSAAATSPHVADGMDKSKVTVTVTDTGNPVTEADVVLDISPTIFMNQMSHYVLHLNTTPAGGGRYVASFPSVVEGPFMIVATELNTLASDSTAVEFTPAPGTTSVIELPSIPQVDPPDDKQNCKDFFKTLDDEFLSSILRMRIAANPPNKAELEQRLADLENVLVKRGPPLVRGPVDIDIGYEKAQAATGQDQLTDAQRDDLKTRATAVKDSFQRLSDKQNELLKQFFGTPIDFTKFQTCTEFFNNFELVANFNDAIDQIRARTPVLRGPDNAGAHIRWAKFANLMLVIPNINAETNTLWRNLKPILAKGSAITTAVLTIAGGRRPVMLDRTTDDFKTLKKCTTTYGRPPDTDAKLKALKTKLIKLVGDIYKPGQVLTQLPTRDGDRVLVATITQSNCVEGNEQALTSRVFSAVTLNEIDDQIFGFGVDNGGATYVAVGTLTGSQASFGLSGFGLTPGIGPAVSAYTGIVEGDAILGTFEGFAQGLLAGQENECNWSGTFVVKPRLECDINGDGQVDRNDIGAIFAVRGTRVGAGDPRDVDGDGTVTVNDARICALRCTNQRCAP